MADASPDEVNQRAGAILQGFAHLVGRRDQPTKARAPEIPDPAEFLWLGVGPSISTIVGGRPASAAELGWHVQTRAGRMWDQVDSMFDDSSSTMPTATTVMLPGGKSVERLAKVQALNPLGGLVQEGWVWVTGTRSTPSGEERVCTPLMSRPIGLSRQGKSWVASPQGTIEVSRHIVEPGLRAQTEHSAEFGGGAFRTVIDDDGAEALLKRMPRLTGWIRAASQAAGFPIARITTAGNPLALSRESGLVAVVGAAIYVRANVLIPVSSESLLKWAGSNELDRTAFGEIYGRDPSDGPRAAGPRATGRDDTILSPLPLDPSQRRAVLAASNAPVAVISGPPGVGKTHTTVALALDAVARGHSVLVVTRRAAARDVLAEDFESSPGPNPILFGNDVSQATLDALERLGTSGAVTSHNNDRTTDLARDAERAASDAISELLTEEQAVLDARALNASVQRQRAPGLFTGPSNVELQRLRDAASAPSRWWSRRPSRARAQLRKLAESPSALQDSELMDAADAALASRSALATLDRGGVELSEAWTALRSCQQATAEALAAQTESMLRDRVADAGPRRTAAVDLARALRSGRARRRDFISGVDADDLLAAAPLWLGTLDELDDVLPEVPAMFDVVMIDEASQVDQLHAATALLRGRRAIVVGDPQQLRHTSFLADARQLEAFGDSAALAGGTVDVRRDSVYDAAVRVAPAQLLDQHHRCTPHLIGFSLSRFYQGRVTLATQHPNTDQSDDIDLIVVEGASDDERSAAARHAALALVDRWAADHQGETIGLITPFAKEADALRELVLARFDSHRIERAGLTVGTVHSYQGAERDRTIVVLGLQPGDARRRTFVEDRHLFNVMVTRARKHLALITADPSPPDGLLADYLRWSHEPPPSPSGVPKAAPAWSRELSAAFRSSGWWTVIGYPVGPWHVDLVVRSPSGEVVAIECGPHPDGVQAHIDRRIALDLADWRILDAFGSRWNFDAAVAASELAATIDRGR